jgi:hypothetical protein
MISASKTRSLHTVLFVFAAKAIAAPAGSNSPADGLKILEKAKAAVLAVTVAQHPCTLTAY